MKPILPKTSVTGLGIPQIRSVLASPGTTIILASPLAPSFTLGVQGVSQASSVTVPSTPTVTLSAQSVPQPTPVILPLTNTKLGPSTNLRSRCPALLVPKNSLPTSELGNQQSPVKHGKGRTSRPQKCKSKQSKIQQNMQHSARCDVDVKPSSYPESAVKSILPKIPQGDAQTVIVIPAVTPAQNPSVVSSLILTSKSSPVVDSVKIHSGQKKCKGRNKEKNIIAKENNKNFSPGLKQEVETSCDAEARSKEICVSEDDPGDGKLKRNRKNVSKVTTASVPENSNTTLKNQINRKPKCKLSDDYTTVPVEHMSSISSQDQMPVPSKSMSLHPVSQLSHQQDVPHHPPPPYPQHADKETSLSSQQLPIPESQEIDKTVRETLCPKTASQKSSQNTKKLCERRHRRQLTLLECHTPISENFLTDTLSCSGNATESQVSSSHSSSQPFPIASSRVCHSYSPHNSSAEMTSKLMETPQSFHSNVVTVTTCSSPTPPTYCHTSDKAQSVLPSLLKSCSTAKDPSSHITPSHPELNSSSLEQDVFSPQSSMKTQNYSSIYSSSSVHSPVGASSSSPPESSSPSKGLMHSPSSVCYSQYTSSYSNMSTSAHSQQSLSSSLVLAVSDTVAVTSSCQSSHQLSYSYQSKTAPYAISARSSSLTQNSQPTPCIPPSHTAFCTRPPQPALSGHSSHSTLHCHSSHPSSYIHSSHPASYTQSHQPPSYAQSPQPASYTQSPQPTSYAQSPQPTSYAQSPQPASYAQSPQATSYTQSPQPASYAQSPQPASYSQSPQPPSYTQSSYPTSFTQSPQSALYTQSPQPTSYAESHQPLLYTQSLQPTSYAHSHHSPSYTQSPQTVLCSHSPQSSSYIQSRHPNTHIQSKHPTTCNQLPQPLTYTVPTQRCVPVNDIAPHSPQAPSFPGEQIPSYCQPQQPDSYYQSSKTTPIPVEISPTNNVVKDDSQSPNLLPYSNPQLFPSSSHYFASPASISYSSIYSSELTNDTHDSHYYSNNKSMVLTPSYSTSEVGSSFLSLERSLSPPSYETHLQNTSSYLTSDHHLSDAHYNASVTRQQTIPTNYSVSCHSSRPEQEDSTVQLDPRKNVRSPPAYPSSTALFPPLPPPRYTSNPKLTPTASQAKYAEAPDMSKGSYKEEFSHAFFPNTPPMVPPPAAPPADIQSDTPHCSMQNYSTSQSHISNHSSSSCLSFSHGSYVSSQDVHCNCDDQEGFQEYQNRACKSVDQQMLYKHYDEETDPTAPACRTSTRGVGINSNENLKVHSLIERAERLWFIPQQEQNRVYMRRKELARDFLSHPNLHSSRNMMLKEKFWIEEDEPIAEEILLSSLTSNPESEQQHHKERNAREVSVVAITDGQQQQEDVNNGPKAKKKKIREMLCQVCGKMLKGCSSLRSHLNSHHNIQPHACPYCSKSFTNRSVLVVHLRIHTGEMPYICNICDTSFRTQSGLMRHKSMHTNVRPYECSMCSKAFKTKLVLQQHLKLHLTGVFTCSDCGKTFERHKSLAVHKASHHYKSRRFPCPHCHKGYHFRSLLNHHMQVHSNIRKHVCSVCNESFVWRSGLAAHKKTHSTSRPQCDVCGVRFASKKRLETHYLRHSDPQPHKCGVCNRSFSHAYRLASHSLTHQGHKEYACPKCSIVLSSAKKLRKHLATNHRKEESRICQLSGTVEMAKSSS